MIASFTGPGFVRLAACAPPTLTTGPAPDRPAASASARSIEIAVSSVPWITTAGQVISPSRSVTSSRVISVT